MVCLFQAAFREICTQLVPPLPFAHIYIRSCDVGSEDDASVLWICISPSVSGEPFALSCTQMERLQEFHSIKHAGTQLAIKNVAFR